MAIAQTLRYYNSQFNPEAPYEQRVAESSVPNVISMYDPQQSQRFIEALAAHQQRYDATKAAVAEHKVRIMDTESFDFPLLKKRLEDFESSINNLVKEKYGGDYAAAANEIVELIGNERTNPFYFFNKQKVAAVKAFMEDQRRLGTHFLSIGNPLKVTFEDWQKGATFDYIPINKAEITSLSANAYKSIADQIFKVPDPQLTPDERLFKVVAQRGVPSQDIIAFVEGKKYGTAGRQIFESILNNIPGIENADSEVVNEIKRAIIQGAYSAVGRTEFDFMTNPFAQDGDEGGVSPIVEFTGYVNAPGVTKEYKEFAKTLAESYKDDRLDKLKSDKKYESIRDILNSVNTYDELRGKVRKNILDAMYTMWSSMASSEATGGAELWSNPEYYAKKFDESIEKTFGITKKQRKALKDLINEIDKDAEKYVSSGEGIDVSPLKFTIRKIPKNVYSTKEINMLKSINDNINSFIAERVTGGRRKLPFYVSFASNKDAKASAEVDPKTVSLEWFTLDPYSPKIFLGVSGRTGTGSSGEQKKYTMILNASNGVDPQTNKHIFQPEVAPLLQWLAHASMGSGSEANIADEYLQYYIGWVNKFFGQ